MQLAQHDLPQGARPGATDAVDGAGGAVRRVGAGVVADQDGDESTGEPFDVEEHRVVVVTGKDPAGFPEGDEGRQARAVKLTPHHKAGPEQGSRRRRGHLRPPARHRTDHGGWPGYRRLWSRQVGHPASHLLLGDAGKRQGPEAVSIGCPHHGCGQSGRVLGGQAVPAGGGEDRAVFEELSAGALLGCPVMMVGLQDLLPERLPHCCADAVPGARADVARHGRSLPVFRLVGVHSFLRCHGRRVDQPTVCSPPFRRVRVRSSIPAMGTTRTVLMSSSHPPASTVNHVPFHPAPPVAVRSTGGEGTPVISAGAREWGANMGQVPRELTPTRSVLDFFGAELRRWRDRAGLSMAELGTRIQYDPSLVGRVERAQQVPSEAFAVSCDRALDTGGALERLWGLLDAQRRQPPRDGSAIAAASPSARPSGPYAEIQAPLRGLIGAGQPGHRASGDAAASADDVVVVPLMSPERGVTLVGIDRRNLMMGMGALPLVSGLRPPAGRESAGGRIGDPEVQEVRRTVEAFKALDDRVGGGELGAGALMETRRVWRLVNTSSFTEAVGRRLRAAAGELAIFTGWLFYDAGRHDQSWYLLNEGLTTARLGDDLDVEIHAYAQMSLLAGRTDRARDAVDLARMGQRVAQRSGSRRLRSLLCAREAQGWGRLGDTRACEQALARARDAFDPDTDDNDPAWISFFTSAELDGLEAFCREHLGQFDRARDLYDRSLQALPRRYLRNRSYLTTGLGIACAETSEFDRAVEAGHQALADVTELSSARVRERVRDLHRRLTHHGPDEPAIRAFDEHYRAVTA